MTLPVRVAQVGDGQLGVVLEGVEGLVTEQLLDVVHVGAGAEQFSGTRSAKRVRRDVGGEAGACSETRPPRAWTVNSKSEPGNAAINVPRND